MLFIRRLAKQILTMFCVQFPLQIAGAVLVGVYLAFKPKSLRLPLWLKWFDGADQYIGRDTSVYDRIMAGDVWAKYTWLCWRNPLNYFNYKYLGFRVLKRNLHTIVTEGDERVGDSTDDHPGFYYIELTDLDGNKFYEYYYIHKWSASKCFRFRMGYKIGAEKDIKDKEWVQDVFVLQPYRSYAGV